MGARIQPWRRILAPLGLLVLLVGGVVLADTSATFDLSWWTVNGGGGTVSGGKFNLSGTAGQYDAADLSGGTFNLSGGYWATNGDKFIYTPLVLANFCGGFPGPRENEPNDNATLANGPLCFFRTYKGSPDNNHPEKESDWFYFFSDGGSFTVSVKNFLEVAQVQLHYRDSSGLFLTLSDQPNGNYIINHNGPAGKYLVRVVASAGHPKGNGDYSLEVTKP